MSEPEVEVEVEVELDAAPLLPVLALLAPLEVVDALDDPLLALPELDELEPPTGTHAPERHAPPSHAVPSWTRVPAPQVPSAGLQRPC